MRNFQSPGRSAVHTRQAAVATSHPAASLAAIEALRSGGNAADAAITAAAVLCVAEPHMTSLGGDCFAIVGKPNGTVHCLNGSGRAAMAVDPDRLRAEGLSDIADDSIHAITTPGAVAAWEKLLNDHGRKGLDTALQPAIDLAERGTPIAPRIASDWPNSAEALAGDPGARRHYLKDGKAPGVADIMTFEALARSMRTIAEKGRDGFYKGWVADDLLGAIQAEGSALTHDDFAAVSADPVTPLRRTYGDVEVLGFPPNTQGLAILVTLGLMEHFGPWSGDPLDPHRLHIFAEAVRRAYAVRNTHLADADMMTLSPEDLVSDAAIERLAATIDPDRMSPFDAAADLTGSHTVYLTVVDEDGMAVSFINSLFNSFGSKRCGPQSGILLQNRGAGFVLDADHPNCIAPGKRPLHTLIPGMVLKDTRPYLSYGVMGGAYQAAGHAWVLSNILDYGMDPQEALDLPRLFLDNADDPKGTSLNIETPISANTVQALEKLGHHTIPAQSAIGGGQVIMIGDQSLISGSDPRKDGLALGY